MRAWLFHIHVFSGLAGPDGHQRVPMIGRSNGDGVDIFVLEQLANIDVGFGLWQSQLLDVPETLVQDRKSTRLNSSHSQISYAVFCLKKKKENCSGGCGQHPDLVAGSMSTHRAC